MPLVASEPPQMVPTTSSSTPTSCSPTECMVIGVFASTLRASLWKIGDSVIIDGLIVNGSAKLVGWVAGVVRHVQTGYLYHYAFSMIIGLLLMLGWFVFLSGGAA